FTRLAVASCDQRCLRDAVSVPRASTELLWAALTDAPFTTGSDAEALVTRPKDLLDNATPAANSLAAVAFLRLGALVGDTSLADRAVDILRVAGGPASRHPTAFAHLLAAADLLAEGVTEIVVDGDRGDLLGVVRSAWRPRAVVAWGTPGSSPLWEGRVGTDAAYVCRNGACDLPARTPDELTAQLTPTP
ncbi:MAG: thioredoxin domain-containing protein, partial [Acidimicrobiales bacterium]|nr:thioredoxin domain-containing protein [Acidimicrobiales bacterium]